MKSISLLCLVALTVVGPSGCSKQTPAPPTRTSRMPHRTRVEDPITQNEREIEADEEAIQRNAERAKREIDAISAEAAHALRKTRENMTAQAKKSHQLSERAAELAAELAEAAKDRAEDLPEEIDYAVQRSAAKIESRFRDLEDQYEESLLRDSDSSE